MGKNYYTDSDITKLFLESLSALLFDRGHVRVMCIFTNINLCKNLVEIPLRFVSDNPLIDESIMVTFSVAFPKKSVCNCEQSQNYLFSTVKNHSTECAVIKQRFLAALKHLSLCVQQELCEINKSDGKEKILQAIKETKDKIKGKASE